MPLSARSGEREGTRRDCDGKGEVSCRGTIAPAIGTHLTQPSPPASGRRGLLLIARLMPYRVLPPAPPAPTVLPDAAF
jgi:hypothetical protein